MVTRRPCLYLPSYPHPPDPLPRRGRGSPRLFHARGSAPCIPGLNPSGTGKGGKPRARRVACLSCRLPTLTLVCFFAPIPPTPFPSGEGGDYRFILPGASPPAPLHLTACGTYSPCHAGAQGLNPGDTEKGRTMHPAGACSLRYRLDLTVGHPAEARRMLKNQK